MALDPKLDQFFGTQESLHLRLFPEQIETLLASLLSNSDQFKSQRMSELLKKKEFSELEWLEWFNWYYVIAQKSGLPKWFSEFKSAMTQAHNIRCMSYPQLLEQGWRIEDVVMSSVFLSDSGISNYHASDSELAHWSRLRRQNLNLFSGAILAGELIGQVGFIKLDEREYELLRQGKLEEENIAGVSDTYTGNVYLYVTSVVVKPEWRKKSLLFKLFKHLISQLVEQESLVARVKGLIALAYTQEGATLSERFNFELVHTMECGELVYTGKLPLLLSSFKS